MNVYLHQIVVLCAFKAVQINAWTEITSIGSTKSWTCIASSSDGSKLVAAEKFIWTSTDSGAHWTKDTSVGSEKFWAAVTSSANGTRLAAVSSGCPPQAGCVPGNIWTSTDSGATWTEVVGNEKYWSDITSSSDGTKLAAVETEFIWTSTDSGATWTKDTSVGTTKQWATITSSSDGTKLAAGEWEFWSSGNSGTTWIKANQQGSSDITGITSSSDGTKLAAVSMNGANQGYTWRSMNSGSTWIKQNSDLIWSDIASSGDGTTVVGVEGGGPDNIGNIWISTDSFITLTKVSFVGSKKDWRGITISENGTKFAATAYNGNIWIHTATESGTTAAPESGTTAAPESGTTAAPESGTTAAPKTSNGSTMAPNVSLFALLAIFIIYH